jgi:hypothetical protein
MRLRLLLMGMVAFAAFSIATTARSQSGAAGYRPAVEHCPSHIHGMMTEEQHKKAGCRIEPERAFTRSELKHWCTKHLVAKAEKVLNRTHGNYGALSFRRDIEHCLKTGKPEFETKNNRS